MKKSRSISCSLSNRETVSGAVYLAFQLLLLPGLLTWCNARFSAPLNPAELNFVFYLINFMAMLLIFHDFLGRSAGQVGQHPAYFCQAVILGFVAYYACNWAVSWSIRQLVPGFSNYNDEAIAAMSQGSRFLMVVGTVILVPPVEECLYRGLIFRNLYGKSRWAAYVVSILAFAVIHVLGYIGRYSPLELLMAVLQYLPAGLCLAWSYTKADTIFAPILIHAAINFISIRSLR
ncbi:MAG: CPBP family intramembrane metalloprotease [Eubacteriales bacterium]|nr:CPBP family intramembrane metalloprotease [Eubacteriales bacterium]